MQIIIAALLAIIATIALLFAGAMFIGLSVAWSDAGEHADVASFVRMIVPAAVVSVVCFAVAFSVMLWGGK